VDMAEEDVLRPVTEAVAGHLLTATAVARHMTWCGPGVFFVMAGGRDAVPAQGGTHVAWAALAGLCRQLACELGPDGIRVVWLPSAGSLPVSSGTGGQSPRARGSGAAAPALAAEPSAEEVASLAAILTSAPGAGPATCGAPESGAGVRECPPAGPLRPPGHDGEITIYGRGTCA
jgi:3-oxoacyl-[acyl-carrier protein] reductase